MLFYFRMLEHENFLLITGVSSIVAAKSRAQTPFNFIDRFVQTSRVIREAKSWH